MSYFLLTIYHFSRPAFLSIALISAALVVACTTSTATPLQTATPTPTIAPTATSVTIADPAELQVIESKAFATFEEIISELGPRESAISQEENAAEYLKTKFGELGYGTEIQPFIVEDLALEGLDLALNTTQPTEYEAVPMTKSGLGDVSGALTPVGLAMPADIPEDGLEGRIALSKRGVIPFQDKAENVFAAGAVGLVVYNNVPRLFRGVLRSQPESPVISLSQADGEAIEELLADSAIEASINLAVESLLSQNVIAEKPGPSEAAVVLGGHVSVTRGMSGGTSDFAPFQNEGVLFMMFFGNDVSRIHSERDTIEFVQPEMLGGASAATVALLKSSELGEWVTTQ